MCLHDVSWLTRILLHLTLCHIHFPHDIKPFPKLQYFTDAMTRFSCVSISACHNLFCDMFSFFGKIKQGCWCDQWPLGFKEV